VIGAGVSGLVAVKELLAEGHEVECFESSEDLGGAFSGPGVTSSRAYESLYLTISNYYMAFSDYPPKDGWKIWSGGEYLQYLRDYATEFKVLPCIKFSTPVEKVRRREDGKWVVTTKGKEAEYDAVAVCCGTHQVPKRPVIAGLEEFEGSVEHSYNFWDAKNYADKKVVVVGLGESSADVVRDVSDVSSSCTLLVRQYPFLLPRVLPDGHPADSMTSRVLYPSRDDNFLLWALTLILVGIMWIPAVMFGLIKQVKWPTPKVDAFGQENELYMDVRTPRTKEVVGLMAKWHAESNVSFVNKYATKNVSWVPNVVNGKIDVQKGKIARVTKKDVVLEDGTVLEDVDAILFCTGYKDSFQFLSAEDAPVDNDVRQLFLHAINPKVGSSLAFIGFSRPTTGAIPACSELIARYFSLLVSEKVSLPANIAERTLQNAQREDSMMYNSLQVRSCVNPCEYMDEVAREIGCYRSPWHYLFHPIEFLHFLTALNCAARFRLTGPHACPELAKKWMDKIPITLPLPALLILCVYKLACAVNLGSGDIMLDLRKRNVEATWVVSFA
jgi:dimethylaniline monooxygenase (N-oxide forming)